MKEIGWLDRHIASLIHESDMKKEQCSKIAYKLECLGISAEKNSNHYSAKGFTVHDY